MALDDAKALDDTKALDATAEVNPGTLVTLRTRDKTLTVTYATIQKIPPLDAQYLRWHRKDEPMFIDSPSHVLESVINEVTPVTRAYLLGLPEEKKNETTTMSSYEYALTHKPLIIIGNRWFFIKCNGRMLKIYQNAGSQWIYKTIRRDEVLSFTSITLPMTAENIDNNLFKLFNDSELFEYFFM